LYDFVQFDDVGAADADAQDHFLSCIIKAPESKGQGRWTPERACPNS
jgi:hypothetical protein